MEDYFDYLDMPFIQGLINSAKARQEFVSMGVVNNELLGIGLVDNALLDAAIDSQKFAIDQVWTSALNLVDGVASFDLVSAVGVVGVDYATDSAVGMADFNRVSAVGIADFDYATDSAVGMANWAAGVSRAAGLPYFVPNLRTKSTVATPEQRVIAPKKPTVAKPKQRVITPKELEISSVKALLIDENLSDELRQTLISYLKQQERRPPTNEQEMFELQLAKEYRHARSKKCYSLKKAYSQGYFRLLVRKWKKRGML